MAIVTFAPDLETGRIVYLRVMSAGISFRMVSSSSISSRLIDGTPWWIDRNSTSSSSLMKPSPHETGADPPSLGALVLQPHVELFGADAFGLYQQFA